MTAKLFLISSVIIILAVIGIVSTASTSLAENQSSQTKNASEAYQDTNSCGGNAPTGMGIRYASPDNATQPKITKEQAIDIASKDTFVVATGPAPVVATHFVLYSNDIKGIAAVPGDDDDADEHLLYQNVPAWVITFCGVNVPMPGGQPTESRRNTLQAHEWNYVINAETGAYIEEFGVH
jgi:hypothetical protein